MLLTSLLFQPVSSSLLFQAIALNGVVYFLFIILILILVIYGIRILLSTLKLSPEVSSIIYLIIAVLVLVFLWNRFGAGLI